MSTERIIVQQAENVALQLKWDHNCEVELISVFDLTIEDTCLEAKFVSLRGTRFAS